MVCGRTADGREECRSFSTGNRSRDELLPAIDDVVRTLGIAPRDFSLLGVDIGPGGFTGLRVSIATVQGIAEISGATVVGVEGATIAAASTPAARAANGEVLVLLAAKKESVWATRLALSESRWHEVGTPGVLDAPPEVPPSLVLADEYLPASWREAFAASGTTVLAPTYDAAVLLDLAEGRAAVGETIAPDQLVPLYPREPEAVRMWKELHG
jgi:tRNA threonylcarbamoyladenosine biosynthesis protein TsaB